jgi:formyltetrahydrofolate deformylase
VLLLSCADQPGLVAVVADVVFRHGGNIVHAEQFVDREDGLFFQRIEFDLANFSYGRNEIATAFAPIVDRFDMRCEIRFSDEPARIASWCRSRHTASTTCSAGTAPASSATWRSRS